jgi:hypothetical protein
MKNVLYGAAAVALLSLAGFLCLLGLEVDHARLIVESNATAARHDLELTLNGDPNSGTSEGMMPLRERLVLEIDHQAGGLRGDLKQLAGDLRKDAGAQLTAIQGNALTAIATAAGPLNTAAGTVEQLRKDLQPSIDHAASITAHADEATAILFRRDALPAQLLGVLGGAKVTLGQTAETMRDIQRATPGFIATWQQIGNHVSLTTDAAAKASLATQHTMENFAAASKPLPTWARIALGVGPPVAQMGAATAAAGSALHWIK